MGKVILTVDDSRTMRDMLKMALRDGGHEVIQADDGVHGTEVLAQNGNIDIIITDINMPRMDGFGFIEHIRRDPQNRSKPILVLTTESDPAKKQRARCRSDRLDCQAVQRRQAASSGPKPKENLAAALDRASTELSEKVKHASRARVRARKPKGQSAGMKTSPAYKPSKSIVAIGSSTGGVEALMEVLSHFPENCPPTVITQHMPGRFTTTFAERLNKLCKPKVTEATDGTPLMIGHVYLAPGSERHLEIAWQHSFVCRLRDGDLVSGHRPSVDVLFDSVARTAGAGAVGVILTGMGRDGATGLKKMRDNGSRTIGQDEASSVVYGMPRAAFEGGAVENQFSLEKIGEQILKLCSIEVGA